MRALAVALVLVLTGCSVVKMHRLRDDWETVDRLSLKRLALVVQPLPGSEKTGEMFARLARRYVHQKKEFLLESDVARASPGFDEATDCAPHIDGVLLLSPTLTPAGGGFEVSVTAKLLRCSDGQEVWAGEAGGTFPSADAGLKEVAANYAGEYGAEVEPYVAPTMRLLRPLLDTLPNPKLNDEDTSEKMTLDE